MALSGIELQFGIFGSVHNTQVETNTHKMCTLIFAHISVLVLWAVQFTCLSSHSNCSRFRWHTHTWQITVVLVWEKTSNTHDQASSQDLIWGGVGSPKSGPLDQKSELFEPHPPFCGPFGKFWVVRRNPLGYRPAHDWSPHAGRIWCQQFISPV